MPDVIFLETARLVFRSHEPSDEAAFVAMHTDEEVRRYVGGQAWPLAKARIRFREQHLGRPTTAFGLWATILKETGAYIGMCGLTGSETGAGLGYYIARPYWGQRFASEAARAFVDFGFETLRLPEIQADFEHGNNRSERILDSLGFGFVREERIERGDRIIDHYTLRSAVNQVR